MIKVLYQNFRQYCRHDILLRIQAVGEVKDRCED